MVRMVKFQTSSFRFGYLEGPILYRMMFASFSVLLAIYFLGVYGLASLVILPVFLLRIQHDFIDEYLAKKIRGITAVTLIPLISDKKEAYEIFGANYGLSVLQDNSIIYIWSSIIGSFSEDMTIIRHPYIVPIQAFKRGVEEYDSLFSNSVYYAEAYFITINKAKRDDFEKTLTNYGIAFTRLGKEEVRVLNDLI